MSEIRIAECGDTPTEAQRDHARASGLYNEGDCVLVWINEGDLCDLALKGRVRMYPLPDASHPYEPRT
jgi:hypothetical protein